MKRPIILILLIIFTLEVQAQIKFEKGYYIDNSDLKHECLVKNKEWQYNPIEFEIKRTETSSPEKLTIDSVREFGVYNTLKYIRQKVNIDVTSQFISEDLDKNPYPVFEEAELFLKVLIEGKASLFSYECADYLRYFYSTDTVGITQLIYKKYLNLGNIQSKNEAYKWQLWDNLKCPDIKRADVFKTNYYKKDLINFFITYNSCEDSTTIFVEKNNTNQIFHLSIRPGINYSSLYLYTPGFSSYSGRNLFYRFGVEGEFILPYNKNKWSIIIEPTYQQFTKSYLTGTIVNYKSLEFSAGFRYNIFLTEKSNLFINTLFVKDLDFNSTIDFKSNPYIYLMNNGDFLNIKSITNFALGFGSLLSH